MEFPSTMAPEDSYLATTDTLDQPRYQLCSSSQFQLLLYSPLRKPPHLRHINLVPKTSTGTSSNMPTLHGLRSSSHVSRGASLRPLGTSGSHDGGDDDDHSHDSFHDRDTSTTATATSTLTVAILMIAASVATTSPAKGPYGHNGP